MYIRPSAVLFSVIALAGAVSAAPSDLEARNDGNSQCNTGSIQCCSSVTSSTSSVVSLLTGLLGINLGDITGQVGLSCSPIVGTGADCSEQPTCCTGNSFNGVIVVGCSPINLGL